MAALKCLVVDSMHESLFPLLTEIGWDIDYQPAITRDAINLTLKNNGYDGLIVRSKTTIDRDLLGENPSVRFIGRAGAGIDNLDVDYLHEKGIHILHASEGNRDAVGEYTVGALLALMRNIPRADQQVRQRVWEREGNRGEEIMGKTIGIIGYGNMGQAFARRLAGFGCNVLAYDKYKTGFSDAVCSEVTEQEIVDQADILSLHIPLTPETKGMVSRAYLDRFKKSIIVVNAARGEIVSLTDLAACVETGKVRGAVLDVLENEKLPTLTPAQQQAFDTLTGKTNVIFTPHIAGWTYESHVKINVALVQKIDALKLAH